MTNDRNQMLEKQKKLNVNYHLIFALSPKRRISLLAHKFISVCVQKKGRTGVRLPSMRIHFWLNYDMLYYSPLFIQFWLLLCFDSKWLLLLKLQLNGNALCSIYTHNMNWTCLKPKSINEIHIKTYLLKYYFNWP